jgi:hypothetical protein
VTYDDAASTSDLTDDLRDLAGPAGRAVIVVGLAETVSCEVERHYSKRVRESGSEDGVPPAAVCTSAVDEHHSRTLGVATHFVVHIPTVDRQG